MLKGRLGLHSARIPHADRHGLLWLDRGRLQADSGNLVFISAGTGRYPAGRYDIPLQMVSCILLEPGTTVTHDVFRLLVRYNTGLLIVGTEGVRVYASMPFGPNDSALARKQVQLWSDPESRLKIARHMYAFKLGEILPHEPIEVLRGIEGARAKVAYQRMSQQYGVRWNGRVYDRQNPDNTDDVNQAINHCATACEAAAITATAIVGAIPQLGFIHEDASISFCLDIADLYRTEITLSAAFMAVKEYYKDPQKAPLERVARQTVGKLLRQKNIIPDMIDSIKSLFAESTANTSSDADSALTQCKVTNYEGE